MSRDDLARRLVAQPGFRWHRGMLTHNDVRLVEGDEADGSRR